MSSTSIVLYIWRTSLLEYRLILFLIYGWTQQNINFHKTTLNLEYIIFTHMLVHLKLKTFDLTLKTVPEDEWEICCHHCCGCPPFSWDDSPLWEYGQSSLQSCLLFPSQTLQGCLCPCWHRHLHEKKMLFLILKLGSIPNITITVIVIYNLILRQYLLQSSNPIRDLTKCKS